MIKIDNLSKKFDHLLAINKVNINISQGEIVGLLGPNGAGKTTTLRIITGVLPASTGNVFINGINLKDQGTKLKKLIGFLPENNPLYEDFTVEEHLQFFSKIKGIDKEKIDDAIEFAVNSTGIKEVYYRPIAELSKGYKQRVGLSQVLLAKPEILILDEPTEGLDPNQRRDIQKLISGLRKKHTIVISSHVLSEVAKICTRIIIIHKGQIVADDTPDNLKNIDIKTSIVEVEIIGRSILSSLKKISGVKEIKEIRKNYFQIVIESSKDIREEIFKTAIEKKWKLLTLFKKQVELEDVFSELTTN